MPCWYVVLRGRSSSAWVIEAAFELYIIVYGGDSEVEGGGWDVCHGVDIFVVVRWITLY